MLSVYLTPLLGLLALTHAAPHNITNRAARSKVGVHDHVRPKLTYNQAGISWAVQELTSTPATKFFDGTSVRLYISLHELPNDTTSI
jgi:hypothetical protein